MVTAYCWIPWWCCIYWHWLCCPSPFLFFFSFPFFCSRLLFFEPIFSSHRFSDPHHSSALAASGGQLPISSLEEAGHMLLGGSGGATVPASLRPSLFLNHPAFLPIVTGSMATVSSPAMGRFSGSDSGVPRPNFPQASCPGASNLMSPSSCPEETPCSSPTSFCSFSEAPSPPLGETMAEWLNPKVSASSSRGGNFTELYKIWCNDLAFEPKPSLIHCSFQLSVSPCWSLSKPKRRKKKKNTQMKKW